MTTCVILCSSINCAAHWSIKNQPRRSVETLGRAGEASRSSGRYETLGLPKNGDVVNIAEQGKKVNGSGQ